MISLHGLSSSIVLDRAPNFANHDLRILLGKLATKLYTLNSYHPQKHGQNTFENLALSTMPRIIIKDKYNSRDEHTYHSVVHKTTNMFPFEVVYGLNPLSPLDLLPLPIHIPLCIRKELLKMILFRKCMRGFKNKYNNK